MSSQRALVVLDLNGTLLDAKHQAYQCERTGRSWPRYDARTPKGHKYIYFRPQMQAFLSWLFQRYEVGVWTSCMKHNAWDIVQLAFPRPPLFVKTREDCIVIPNGEYSKDTIKDLTVVWSEYAGQFHAGNTILVENTAQKGRLQPQNLLLVREFAANTPETDDYLLTELAPRIQTMLK